MAAYLSPIPGAACTDEVDQNPIRTHDFLLGTGTSIDVWHQVCTKESRFFCKESCNLRRGEDNETTKKDLLWPDDRFHHFVCHLLFQRQTFHGASCLGVDTNLPDVQFSEKIATTDKGKNHISDERFSYRFEESCIEKGFESPR